jgi:hypothetical protein
VLARLGDGGYAVCNHREKLKFGGGMLFWAVMKERLKTLEYKAKLKTHGP